MTIIASWVQAPDTAPATAQTSLGCRNLARSHRCQQDSCLSATNPVTRSLRFPDLQRMGVGQFAVAMGYSSRLSIPFVHVHNLLPQTLSSIALEAGAGAHRVLGIREVFFFDSIPACAGASLMFFCCVTLSPTCHLALSLPHAFGQIHKAFPVRDFMLITVWSELITIVPV